MELVQKHFYNYIETLSSDATISRKLKDLKRVSHPFALSKYDTLKFLKRINNQYRNKEYAVRMIEFLIENAKYNDECYFCILSFPPGMNADVVYNLLIKFINPINIHTIIPLSETTYKVLFVTEAAKVKIQKNFDEVFQRDISFNFIVFFCGLVSFLCYML